MRILVLCEGDAETWDAWSGCAKGIVDALRAAGHEVTTFDVDLYGRDRWLAAVRSFAPSRERWGVKFRFLAEAPFRMRSRRAARCVRARAGETDVVLQIGATFDAGDAQDLARALYCDSNIAMSRRGASTGFSTAAPLAEDELDRIAARERRVYHRMDRVFTLSEVLRQSFVDDFGLPPERVVTAPGGANFETAPASAAAPSADAPTVLFVGRRFHRKGGDLLLEAFARVRAALPNAVLEIAGPGERYADDPGVTWLGNLHKEGLAAAFGRAHVFCLPTRFEPYGVAYLEAMGFGLPCVGPDAWAVPEMVADGETGLLFPPGDVEALSERLLRLLREPALAERMGRAGRERAERGFTWAHAAERITEALTPLLARTP